ncbi:MAG: hypothetical protein ABR949_12350 [Candidatus Aquilonibacter sp.]
MVTVELVPFLAQLRDLYTQPRGFARFQEYLNILRTETGEMELPISNVNPMAKPHVLARVEELLALGAETVALEAAREGSRRLGDLDEALRLILIVADDAAGGWTNRAFAEFAHRYESKHQVQRGWVVVMLWSSEKPSAGLVRRETLTTLYRTIDERKHGPVRKLREVMEREGRAMRFAAHERRYDDVILRAIREKIEPHLDSHAAPIVFAALYGDATAESLGYPPLGIPDRGGYELALADAGESKRGPLARSPLV